MESINETLQIGLGFILYSGAFDDVDYKPLHSAPLRLIQCTVTHI